MTSPSRIIACRGFDLHVDRQPEHIVHDARDGTRRTGRRPSSTSIVTSSPGATPSTRRASWTAPRRPAARGSGAVPIDDPPEAGSARHPVTAR